MTVSYTPDQKAQIIANVVAIQTSSFTISNLPAAGLFRFDLSTNIMFNYPLEFNLTLVPGYEYFVLLPTDTDSISTLTNGALASTLIPSAYASGLFGTAESYELARETPTSASHSFTLDLALVSRFLSTSQQYSNPWNGSLLLWVCTDGLGGTTSGPTLSAYGTIDYDNRDTGSPGINSSRWSRCPV